MKTYLKEFFSIWFVVLLLNQIFLFGACFLPHCIVAALPHTGIISFFLAMALKEDTNKEEESFESVDLNSKNYSVDLNSKNYSKVTKSISTTEDKRKEVFKSLEGIVRGDIKNNPLKEKGDAFERYIGKKFEEKGEIVIYNGFIKGYEDSGVDIISICKDKKTINLIQCKNWTKKTLTLDYIVDIYSKLSSFNFDFRCYDKDKVCKYLQSSRVINKLKSQNILDDVYYNYNKYTIRKTLYISSDKVVDLKIGQELKMMKENIFRYKDMKIVVRSLG